MSTLAPEDPDGEELAGYFGPQSMTWRLASESFMLLGSGRAVLMQLAHPLVGAGVGQHSGYHQDPWGRTGRTLELTQQITFGTRSQARAAAREFNLLHSGVTGALAEPAGALAASTPYRARDPELLLWVFATLVDTALLLYPMLAQPLTEAEQEQYYQESRRSVALLSLASALRPATLEGFRSYVREMLAGSTLAVTPEAREVARIVMCMPVPAVLRPFLAVTEQITIGLLPPRLRQMYGLSWDWPRHALLEAWAASTRRLLPFLPALVREPPWARAAWRRVRADDGVARCA
jgi:uncharacterized protein (DUF2236 family)